MRRLSAEMSQLITEQFVMCVEYMHNATVRHEDMRRDGIDGDASLAESRRVFFMCAVDALELIP